MTMPEPLPAASNPAVDAAPELPFLRAGRPGSRTTGLAALDTTCCSDRPDPWCKPDWTDDGAPAVIA